MNAREPSFPRRTVATASGNISYLEHGTGPVALLVHGVLLNGHLWRHQLTGLGDIRRCIAPDLLAHGHTEIAPTQDVSSVANATMLAQFLDALGIDRVDLVGNDSGGGIAQIFAAEHPERVRSLALTDCDTHDNWPPEAFKPFLQMAAAGGLAGALQGLVANKAAYRSREALGPAYEHPELVSDETIETYLGPLIASPSASGTSSGSWPRSIARRPSRSRASSRRSRPRRSSCGAPTTSISTSSGPTGWPRPSPA